MMARRSLAIAAGVFVCANALAAGFVTGAAAKVGTVVVATDGSATYSDTVGDQPTGMPDITAATVSDVSATGLIRLSVTVTSIHPGTDADLEVFIDTDKAADSSDTAGSPFGCEYLFEWVQEPDASGWTMLRWDSVLGGWKIFSSSAMSFSQDGDTLTWTVGKADMGVTSGLSFLALVPGSDVAPNSGKWVYDISAPPTPAAAVKPVISAPSTTTAKAVAGKRFTVSFLVTRSDNGAPLTSGKMICDPSVVGKIIPHQESFTSGTAKLSFTVPKTAKGKLLKVKVTIKAGIQSTTRVATFRIG